MQRRHDECKQPQGRNNIFKTSSSSSSFLYSFFQHFYDDQKSSSSPSSWFLTSNLHKRKKKSRCHYGASCCWRERTHPCCRGIRKELFSDWNFFFFFFFLKRWQQRQMIRYKSPPLTAHHNTFKRYRITSLHLVLRYRRWNNITSATKKSMPRYASNGSNLHQFWGIL